MPTINLLTHRLRRDVEVIIAQARRFINHTSHEADTRSSLEFFFLHVSPLHQAFEDRRGEILAGDWNDPEFVALVQTCARVMIALYEIETLRKRYEEGQPCYNRWWKGKVEGVMVALKEIGDDSSDIVKFQTEAGP